MLAQFYTLFLVQLDNLRGLHGLSLVFSACAAEYLPLFLFCGTLRGRGCILRRETSCNTPDRIARLRAFFGACARCFRPRAFFCVRILSGSPLDTCPGSAPAACRDLDRRGLLLPILLDLAARPALVPVVASCRSCRQAVAAPGVHRVLFSACASRLPPPALSARPAWTCPNSPRLPLSFPAPSFPAQSARGPPPVLPHFRAFKSFSAFSRAFER